MVFKKWEEIRKCSSFLWVGRRKVKRIFRRFCFRAASRVSGKTGTERLHGRTGETCPNTGGLEWKFCATSVGRTYYKEIILCIGASIGLRFL